MNKKRIVQNLILAISVGIITILLLELAARMLISHPRYDRKLTDIWYIGVPNRTGIYKTDEFTSRYSFNSLGFRDDEHAVIKPDKTCRIAILGDSLAEMIEINLNQTWAKLLEKKLNRNKRNLSFEILNFGLSGGGTATEYFVMEEYALKYYPDVIILTFSVLTDVNDDYFDPVGKYYALGNDGNLTEVGINSKSSSLEKFAKGIARNSYLAIFLKKRYDVIIYSKNPGALADHYGVFQSNYPAEWDNAWKLTKALIGKINEEARNNDILLVLLVGNAKEQADIGEWNRILSSYPVLAEKSWDLEKPNKILRKICNDLNISCIDPHDEFLESNKAGNKTHYKLNIHWNKEGNELLSEYILSNLQDDFLSKCYHNK